MTADSAHRVRILLFGPPGVGKGTHAKRLASELGIPHVASGDLLRQEVERKSPLGLEAWGFISQGELAPDDLVVAMLRERLSRPDAAAGYLLDGFPRTLPQAHALDARLKEQGARIDHVVWLDAPEDSLVERIAGRRTCLGCGASFHQRANPPRVAGVCDRCGGGLSQRHDDDESTVRRRLITYREKTAPVLAFFRDASWQLDVISALGAIEDVYARIRAAVVGGQRAAS